MLQFQSDATICFARTPFATSLRSFSERKGLLPAHGRGRGRLRDVVLGAHVHILGRHGALLISLLVVHPQVSVQVYVQRGQPRGELVVRLDL